MNLVTRSRFSKFGPGYSVGIWFFCGISWQKRRGQVGRRPRKNQKATFKGGEVALAQSKGGLIRLLKT
jgi:hypothetical protein